MNTFLNIASDQIIRNSPYIDSDTDSDENQKIDSVDNNTRKDDQRALVVHPPKSTIPKALSMHSLVQKVG